MELNKYIPGDLAMINGDIVKIMAVCFNYNLNIIQNYDVMFPNGNIYKYEAESLKEIPLTPEILEKNGWKKDGKWYYLKTRRAYLYTIQDAGQPDEFLICANTDKHNLTSVSFVHQLQHLLFGLGLNSEMEV